MMDFWGTFVLYNVCLIMCVLFCVLAGKYKIKSLFVFAYFIILLIAIFRFDIGHDYQNYAVSITRLAGFLSVQSSFAEIAESSGLEPAMLILVYLLKWTSNVYVYVVAIYAVVYCYFIYKTLDRYNIHCCGIIVLFILTILFQSWDWMRQGVALSIFLFSIKYIEKESFKPFILCILFASLWHYSALVLLLTYPLRKVYVKPKLLALLLLLLFFVAELGFFQSLYDRLLSMIPYYGEIYSATRYSSVDQYTYQTMPFVFYSIWYIVLIYLSSKEQNMLVLFVFIGAALFIVSGGSLLMDRIAWYYTSLQIILIPLILRENKGRVKSIILLLFLIMHFLYFNRQIFNGGLRGCTPYSSVFSDDYRREIFRLREYTLF